MKILHVISGLKNGGAEKTLLKLVNTDKENTHLVFVLSRKHDFYSGYFRQEVDVIFAEGALISMVLQCLRLMRVFRPQIIQGWMYHANLFSVFLKTFGPGSPIIVWNIRNNNLRGLKLVTKVIVRISGLISNWMHYKCIYPSYSAKNYHESLFFRNSIVIPNGYDFNIVNTYDRENAVVFKLLMVARWDIQKDHLTLISAFANLKNFNWKLTLVGEGINSYNHELIVLLRKYNLEEKVILIDATSDIDAIYKSHDVLLLTSISESFPNVILEALAHGLLPISTNVGDVEIILNNNKWLFEVGDVQNLRELIESAYFLWIDKDRWRNELETLRMNTIDKYRIDVMVERYNFVWRDLILENV